MRPMSDESHSHSLAGMEGIRKMSCSYELGVINWLLHILRMLDLTEDGFCCTYASIIVLALDYYHKELVLHFQSILFCAGFKYRSYVVDTVFGEGPEGLKFMLHSSHISTTGATLKLMLLRRFH